MLVCFKLRNIINLNGITEVVVSPGPGCTIRYKLCEVCNMCHGKLPTSLRLTPLHWKVYIVRAVGLGYATPHPFMLHVLWPSGHIGHIARSWCQMWQHRISGRWGVHV